jgi:hypothetical protein
MKYHCQADQKGGEIRALCGSVLFRPDTYIYPEDGFNGHYAKEFECKRCREILDKKNGGK